MPTETVRGLSRQHIIGLTLILYNFFFFFQYITFEFDPTFVTVLPLKVEVTTYLCSPVGYSWLLRYRLRHNPDSDRLKVHGCRGTTPTFLHPDPFTVNSHQDHNVHLLPCPCTPSPIPMSFTIHLERPK